MVRGQYISGTGMMLQRRKMESITHNITNADTSGYKKDQLVSRSFDDVLIQRINDSDPSIVGVTRQVGPLNFGTRVDQVFVAYEQGSMEPTGNETDLALAGEGFFVLETPAGERYTRAGAFLRTQDGYLVDAEGHFVLGTEGRVQVGTGSFAIDSAGNVTVDGQVTNRLRTVTFDNLENLRKQGSNLYYTYGANPTEAQSEVKQGFLENSNVEIAREMVDMITVYRAYESNQRMLTMIDETIGKAVNEIGRLR